MALRLSSLSTEYIRVPVTARDNGVAVDPTNDPVEFAFIAHDAEDSEPDTGDWITGDWEVEGDTYYARCLVGPEGDIALEDGTYAVWVHLTAAPEEPHRRAGRVVIF